MTVLTKPQRAQFDALGFVRVPAAFGATDARRMRDAVWEQLGRRGIRRDDRSTWTVEAPDHLQRLKRSPVFEAADTSRARGAIDDVLGVCAWVEPANCGAFFILFPTPQPWTVPTVAWHIDASYTDPLAPPAGLKVHSLFGDVAPRAGGMTVVAGSHRVVARYAEAEPPRPGESTTRIRRRLMRSDPWFRELCSGADPDERIARFVESEHEVFGVPVRVTELTGRAGDVILMHPLLLHARPTNAGEAPRFLLNQDLRIISA